MLLWSFGSYLCNGIKTYFLCPYCILVIFSSSDIHVPRYPCPTSRHGFADASGTHARRPPRQLQVRITNKTNAVSKPVVKPHTMKIR